MKMAYEFLNIEKELERIIPAIAELSAREFYSHGITFEGTDELIDLRRELYWLLGSRRIEGTYAWENKLAKACYDRRMEGGRRLPFCSNDDEVKREHL
jgi:hypothetical protein